MSQPCHALPARNLILNFFEAGKSPDIKGPAVFQSIDSKEILAGIG
jgi:hypothetical protein